MAASWPKFREKLTTLTFELLSAKRFKMERQGLVEEGQQVEVTERSPNTNLFTYVVEPAVAMSGIYKTSERIHARQGVIKEIQHTDRGYYLIVEFDE